MLRRFWKPAPSALNQSPPAPNPPENVQLSDDELEHVAGGLERVYPYPERTDPSVDTAQP